MPPATFAHTGRVCRLCFRRALRRPTERRDGIATSMALVLLLPFNILLLPSSPPITLTIPVDAREPTVTTILNSPRTSILPPHLARPPRATAAVGHGLWRAIRRVHRLLVYTPVPACLGAFLLATPLRPHSFALTQHPCIALVASFGGYVHLTLTR
ncbi:hypothetical protein B0H16DRAFT_1830425 [Mycena metata]|uniref:Uncharacterized protein n=1 Tax=Mycena metata TaxID=1033252 RepID=A0AAD7K7E3_9AGAR|nr:hypothetical protein B0H16DRAFT_1830425 [Mycena metata]